MYLKIAAENYLNRLDPTGELQLQIVESGSASVDILGIVSLNHEHAQRFLYSKEVIHLKDGTTFAPKGYECIAGTMAHETAHWMKRHLQPQSKYARLSRTYASCQTASYILLSTSFVLLLYLTNFCRQKEGSLVTENSINKYLNFVMIFSVLALGLAIFGSLLSSLLISPIKKNLEFEADRVGMDLLKRAGMRPEIMVWQRKVLYVQEKDVYESYFGRFYDKYFSTHPPHKQRYERCLEHLEKLQSNNK